jgi:colanic acid biosynthesis glycosyl transferase WcaI
LYFEPDIGANAVIVTELAEELVNHGHHVTVVTGFPHYATNVTEGEYKGKIITREISGNLNVIRTYLFTSSQKDRFHVRFLNYISFNILSTIAGLFSGHQDIILAPSPPLTIGLSAAIIGFFKRIPYLYNVQDINPDVLIKLGILKNRLFIRFAKGLEKFVYRFASQITVLSQGFKDNLLKKGVPESKLTIIPNFIDPDFVKPLPRENDFRIRLNLQEQFVVLYAGNLGHSQNLEHLLACAKSMVDEKDIIFLIVGNGSRELYLKTQAQELSLANVIFLPFQPCEEVPLIYGAADVSLVTLKKGIALDSVPSKLYTIMASARPVVAAVDQGSDAWQLVEKANCGVCVEPENPLALQRAITALKEDPKRRSELGNNGRRYVVDHHTRKMIGNTYHDLMTRLIYEE